MNFFTLFAILAVFIGSSVSLRLNSHDGDMDEDRIIGGVTAKPGQFPYLASVRHRVTENGTAYYRHRCGGSIISNRWILSVAHWTKGVYSSPSASVIFVGAHHIRDDGQMYPLRRIVNHPLYAKRFFRNDISLLETARVIQLNDLVKIIPLNSGFVDAGVVSIVSGWGDWRTSKLNPTPTHLQLLRLNTITNEDCRSRHTGVLYVNFIYNGTLCALPQEKQGICQGDAGGPLVSNGQLIGVTSWAFTCAHQGAEGFTRISSFLNWIRDVSGVVAV